MGLDTVELVMALEREFEVMIPDQDAQKLVLVGDISDYLSRRLEERGETMDEDEVWERVKRVVVENLGVPPERVMRNAHIIHDLGAD